MDLASLGIRIDSTQALAGAKALEQLAKAAQGAETAENKLSEANKKSEHSAGLAASGWTKARTILSGLAATASTYLTISRGLAVSEDAQRRQAAFTFLLGSARAAREEIDALKGIAAGTPLSGGFVADLGQRLLAVNIDAERANRTVKVLIDLMAVSGRGPEFVERAIDAFTRLESKGKASAQELAQLARQNIPVWDLLAQKIGTSIPQAMKQAEEGGISFDTAMEAILSGLEERFPDAAKKITSPLTTAFMQLKEGLKSTGKEISEAFSDATDLPGTIETIADATKGLGDVVSDTVRILGGARREQEEFSATSYVLAAALRAATLAGLAFTGMFVVGKITAYIAGLRILVAQTLSVAGATTVAASSVSLLQVAFFALSRAIMANPIGLLITGAALAASAIYTWTQSTEDNTAAMAEQTSQLKDLQQAQKDLYALRQRQETSKSIGDDRRFAQDLAQEREEIFKELNRLRGLQQEFLTGEQETAVRGILGPRGKPLPETPKQNTRKVWTGEYELPDTWFTFAALKQVMKDETYTTFPVKVADAIMGLEEAYANLGTEVDVANKALDDSTNSNQKASKSFDELTTKLNAARAGYETISKLNAEVGKTRNEIDLGKKGAFIREAQSSAFKESLSGGGTIFEAGAAAKTAGDLANKLLTLQEQQEATEKAGKALALLFKGDLHDSLQQVLGLFKAGKTQEGVEQGVNLLFPGFKWGASRNLTEGAVKAQEEQIALLRVEGKERAMLSAEQSIKNAATAQEITLTDGQIAALRKLAGVVYDLTEAEARRREEKQKNESGETETENLIESMRKQLVQYEGLGKTMGMTADQRERYLQLEQLNIELAKGDALGTREQRIELEKLGESTRKAIESAQENAKVVALSEDIATAIAQPFEELIINLSSVKDAVESVLRGIQQSMLRNLVTGPLQQQLSAFFQSLFSSLGMAAGMSPGGGGGREYNRGLQVPSYHGNVFRNGRLIPHARGGVVDELTYFPMRDGNTGSMGEHGRPEGILPLGTTPSGDLGVKVVNNGPAPQTRAPAIITNNFRIMVTSDSKYGETQRQAQRNASRYSRIGQRQ